MGDAPTMTPEQRALARHALGLPNRKQKSYRNRFVTGPGSLDHGPWMAMVAAGYTRRFSGNTITGEYDLFLLTRKGATLALYGRERLDPENFPQATP